MDQPDPTPAGVLADHLVAHLAAMRAADEALRDGDPEGVHDARVGCRRLRADLATYRPLLDRVRTGPFRSELGWLARTLGSARDTHVVHERLRSLVDREQVALVVGPVRERLEESGAAAMRAAQDDVDAALGSTRYAALLETLEVMAANPPWTEAPEQDDREAVRRRVRRRGSELRVHADAVAGAEDRDTALHEARKAAKKLRYAAEGTVPLWGDEVRRVAAASHNLTVLLGEHHDTVVCRTTLLGLAAAARADGDSDFTFGRLHAREQSRAGEIDREFEDLWRRLRQRSRLREWLA